jgi:hypothetical protein
MPEGKKSWGWDTWLGSDGLGYRDWKRWAPGILGACVGSLAGMETVIAEGH